MPCAPASIQASTAVRTSGMSPPLEFRNVATLLTLTLKQIILSPFLCFTLSFLGFRLTKVVKNGTIFYLEGLINSRKLKK